MTTFTSDDICKALHNLGVNFQSIGPELKALSFKSLRKVEPAGIFYLEGAAPAVATTIRGSLIVCSSIEGLHDSNSFLLVKNPQLAFYKLMRHFFEPAPQWGIHPTAVVDPLADIHPEVEIGPYCIVGKACLKQGVRLKSHVVVADNSIVGSNTVIEPHSTIGATGVVWVWDEITGERVVQPQIGGVEIGDDCFIGSDVSIVKGSVNESTRIGRGTVMAHGTKIGHGCTVGEYNHFANNVSLAGNVHSGTQCFFGSACVVRPMVKLAERTTVGVGAVVVGDVDSPDLVLMGVPAKPFERKKEKLSGVPKQSTGE